jgi:hypothetical protein
MRDAITPDAAHAESHETVSRTPTGTSA